MRLRYKFNLVSVGMCILSAVIFAGSGKLGMASIAWILACLNWYVALAGEKFNKEETN